VTTVRSVKKQIEQMGALPTIPAVVRKLLEVLENPKVSLAEIATIIAQDPVLAAKILKVVNSPIYGFPGRISSLTQALLLLGLNVARGLLLGVSVLDIMQRSIVGLWEHSVGCAIAARIIARRKGLKDAEEVSVAGLLHDIGKVFLSLKFPDIYGDVIAQAGARAIFIAEAERESFGVTHAEVEAWIGRKWNFPQNLVEQMAYHHNPGLSKQYSFQTAIIHFSDILVKGRGFGFGGDNLVPSVNETAWQLLDLSDADIREILIEMEDVLEQTEDLLLAGKAA
jgi:putative nucleotidyltransferase with HDIG domain